jgi:hypothetical protein
MSNDNIIKDIETGLVNAEHWLAGEFSHLKGVIAPSAVSVVEAIQAAEASGILDAVAAALAPVTNQLSVVVNNDIKLGIPVALAIGLGIEGLPANATPEDIAAFEQRILVATGNKNILVKGTWESNVGAQIYGLVQTAILSNAGTANAGTLTLAQIIPLIEKAFQAIQAAKAAAAADAAATADASAQ